MSHKYELYECFVYPMFVNNHSCKLLKTFNWYWLAVVYRWYLEFEWEAATYVTWQLEIRQNALSR
jgi:hypothetical protein